ncbi:hypothetical protein LTR37_019037 [Vermiconidia calcicola]|uniref:Uncharacterized protein n=1 Tax=Vermiconidia calcicola TaxID=1690605 RepID=A0ACC3MFK4_9PEZI|nr:hypothetical protein LTR37_019037 [Vermiconidia calcicola]
MLGRESTLAVMFAFLFGFSSIRAEDIPDGVMPKRQIGGEGVIPKRQVQGTGPTSSTIPDPTSSTQAPPTSTTAPPDPDPTTSDTPDPTSNTPDPDPTSNTPDPGPTSNSPDPTSADPVPSTTQAPDDDPTTTDDSSLTTDDSSPTSDDSPPTTDDNSPTSVDSVPSSTVPTVIESTTTNADGERVTTRISTNTVVGGGAVQTQTTGKNPVVKVGSTTINPSTLSRKTTVRQALVTEATRREIATSYWTDANGVSHSSVYTTTDVYARTTGYATATIAPGLAHQGGSGANLSDSAKNIIGGVVGGVGGALLIGGLAFVAWRLWGKKKQAAQQDDIISGQKRESTMTYNNSESRYTNPNGAVNTASNF